MVLALWGVDRWRVYRRGVGEARQVLGEARAAMSLDEAIASVEEDAREEG